MTPRRIVVVAFDALQSLDAVGPIEVFSTANRELGTTAYAIELVATTGPTIRATNGLALTVDHRISGVRGPLDTLVVAGGEGTAAALQDRVLIDGVRRLADRAARVASVCTGAFLLAEAGVLDGRRATTHWTACERMARQ